MARSDGPEDRSPDDAVSAPTADRLRPRGTVAAVKKAAKFAFAAADLALGRWPGARILCYHQTGANLGREMEIPTEALRKQLDWVATNGRVLRLEEALEPDNIARADTYVLTFDDGYEDLFTNAYPMLLERGLPFTLYLTTAPVETRQPLTPGGQADPLSWDQIEAMLEGGLMTLGAHTHTHPDLRGMSTEQIAEELETSDDLIERRFGFKPRHFAYPKGYWAPAAEGLIRDRYESAALGSGKPLTEVSDLHRLDRIPIQRSDGYFFFRRKVSRGMRLEERTRRVVRGYQVP